MKKKKGFGYFEMNSIKRYLLSIAILGGLMTNFYYYLRMIVPIEITNQLVFLAINSIFCLVPFAFWVAVGMILPEKYQGNKVLSWVLIPLMFLNVLHNTIWFLIILAFGRPCQNVKRYPQKENESFVVVEQFCDQGSIGAHSKLVKVYELLPGFRLVKNID